jgi:hypothetical protein
MIKPLNFPLNGISTLLAELYLSKKFAILVIGTKLRTEATQRQDILLKSSSTNST